MTVLLTITLGVATALTVLALCAAIYLVSESRRVLDFTVELSSSVIVARAEDSYSTMCSAGHRLDRAAWIARRYNLSTAYCPICDEWVPIGVNN